MSDNTDTIREEALYIATHWKGAVNIAAKKILAALDALKAERDASQVVIRDYKARIQNLKEKRNNLQEAYDELEEKLRVEKEALRLSIRETFDAEAEHAQQIAFYREQLEIERSRITVLKAEHADTVKRESALALIAEADRWRNAYDRERNEHADKLCRVCESALTDSQVCHNADKVWLIARIEKFRVDGFPVTAEAEETAGYFTIVPTKDGGLQIEAHAGGADVEIGIHENGEIEDVYLARALLDARIGEK